MMFRTSTRSKSDHGAHPQAMRNSWRRKKQSEGKDLSAAARHRARDLAGRLVLANEFRGDQRERNSRQKKKERRGQRAEALRPVQERGVARVAAQPCIVTVRLKHQDAGQAAHPVDPVKARRHGVSLTRRQARTKIGAIACGPRDREVIWRTEISRVTDDPRRVI